MRAFIEAGETLWSRARSEAANARGGHAPLHGLEYIAKMTSTDDTLTALAIAG